AGGARDADAASAGGRPHDDHAADPDRRGPRDTSSQVGPSDRGAVPYPAHANPAVPFGVGYRKHVGFAHSEADALPDAHSEENPDPHPDAK
ncbi:hypothetical protein, partial [Microtetraspora niveoalba]|uniref:hypothetical protein n=1 Tax=Microtetraspora niveoalba TaxID=46175 RepID=UPI001C3F4BCA